MLEPVEPSGPRKKEILGKWDYLAIPNGTTAVGYLAGYPVCCKTHHNNGTKACRKWMSKHTLQCVYCNDGHEPEDKAYVPFWSREYLGQFVLIPYAYVESVREIKLHSQIKLSRHKNPKSPVIIREELWSAKSMPVNDTRREPADLMPVLVRRIWKDKELERYADSVVAQITANSAIPPVVSPVEKPTTAPVVPPKKLSGPLAASFANHLLEEGGHQSRIATDKDGNLVPIGDALPSLNGTGKKPKPK